MATITETSPIDSVQRQLRKLSRHLRLLTALRGLGTWIAVTLLLAGACLGADFFFALGSPIRLGLLCLLCLVSLAVLFRRVVAPMFAAHERSNLAAIIDQSHPELNEQLTSMVELNDESIPEEEKGSPLMRRLLTRDTVTKTSSIDFDESVSAAPTAHRMGLAVFCVAAFCSPFLFSGDGYSLLMHRLVTPWKNLETAGNLYFELSQGDVVIAQGEDFELTAMAKWRFRADELPEKVYLEWRTEKSNGEMTNSQRRLMVLDREEQSYSAKLQSVQEDFTYSIQYSGGKSRDYSVRVVERPVIQSVELELTPPAYTRRATQIIPSPPVTLSVFERSKLSFSLELSKPIAEAAMTTISLIDGEPMEDVVEAGDVVIAEDGLSVKLGMPAITDQRIALRITDEHGLSNEGNNEYQVIVTADQAPSIQLEGTTTSLTVRPRDPVEIGVAATDDISVEELELHLKLDREGQQTEVVSVDAALLAKQTVQTTIPIDFSKYQLPENSIITYRIRAADGREIPGPNETWSSVRTIVVSSNADSAAEQQAEQRQEKLEQEIDEILDRLREHQQNLETQKNRFAQKQPDQNEPAKNEPAQDDAAQEATEVLTDQQKDLEESVRNLADKLEQLPLYQMLSLPTRSVADQDLAQAREKLNNSPADAEMTESDSMKADGKQPPNDEGESEGSASQENDKETGDEANDQPDADAPNSSKVQKQQENGAAPDTSSSKPLSERLQESNDQIDNAVAHMEEIREAFEEIAELERDLQKLADLSNKANELNEAANGLQQQRMEGVEDEAFDQQREQLEEQRRELDEELSDLIEDREELRDAATKFQMQRLQDLARQSGQLAREEEMVADAIEQEQERQSNQPKPSQADTDGNEASTDPESGESSNSKPTESPESTQASSEQEASPNDEMPSEAPNDQQGNESGESSTGEMKSEPSQEAPGLAELQQRQAELAREASELAIETAKKLGSQSEAAQQAKQAAEQSQAAQRQSETGQLDRAAESGKKSAEELANSSQAAGQESSDAPRDGEALAKDLQALSDAQEELARQMSQQANDANARQQARDSAQQRVQSESESIERQLQEIAEQLGAAPIDERNKSQSVSRAAGKANTASRNIQQAQSKAGESDLDQAEQLSRRASDDLDRLSQELNQIAEKGTAETPVPADVGDQVAEALRQLREAARQLQESRAKPQNGERQSSNESQQANAQQSDSSRQSNAQANSQQQGQPSNQQGMPTQSPNQDAFNAFQQNTQKAAQALAEAIRQVSPASSQASSQSSGQSEPNDSQQASREPGATDSDNGAQSDQVDLSDLDAVFEEISAREWGQLPGKLRTEILQAQKRKPDADYSRLIKLYFEEISNEPEQIYAE